MNIINLEPEKAKKYKRLLDVDKTYWFTSISHDHELHNLLDSIPQNILDFIKNGPINLIISNECECFESVPLEIYKSIIIRGKIPERKILFLSGAGNITDIVSRIKDDINVKFGTGFTGFDSKFCGWYQYDLASLAKNRRSSNFKRNLALNGNVVYKKHFLLLNNRWRLHRPTLVGLLHAKNLLDYGYVSLGSNDQNFDWHNVFEQILNINRSNTLVCDLLESNKAKIQSLGYLDLDTSNYKEKTIVDEYSGRLDKYFETSFMSVVTETSFYNSETPFLTEKTFKPIIYRQPFILACVPGSLSFLRELGYKTFHPYIDESYDLERNDTERMWKIVAEIERICTLSSQELKGLSQELRDICNYNYNQLMSHGN